MCTFMTTLILTLCLGKILVMEALVSSGNQAHTWTEEW